MRRRRIAPGSPRAQLVPPEGRGAAQHCSCVQSPAPASAAATDSRQSRLAPGSPAVQRDCGTALSATLARPALPRWSTRASGLYIKKKCKSEGLRRQAATRPRGRGGGVLPGHGTRARRCPRAFSLRAHALHPQRPGKPELLSVALLLGAGQSTCDTGRLGEETRCPGLSGGTRASVPGRCPYGLRPGGRT